MKAPEQRLLVPSRVPGRPSRLRADAAGGSASSSHGQQPPSLPALPRNAGLHRGAAFYESTRRVLHRQATESQDRMFPALHGADGSTGTDTASIQPAHELRVRGPPGRTDGSMEHQRQCQHRSQQTPGNPRAQSVWNWVLD